MILIVSAVSGEEELYGLPVSDLQSNVIIDGNSISGVLQYVPQYSGYSSVAEEQSGYYLALKIDTDAGATVTTQKNNKEETSEAVPVTDGFCVYRISDKDSQTISIHAEQEDHLPVICTYTLSGLELGNWLQDSEKEKLLDKDGDKIRTEEVKIQNG